MRGIYQNDETLDVAECSEKFYFYRVMSSVCIICADLH